MDMNTGNQRGCVIPQVLAYVVDSLTRLSKQLLCAPSTCSHEDLPRVSILEEESEASWVLQVGSHTCCPLSTRRPFSDLSFKSSRMNMLFNHSNPSNFPLTLSRQQSEQKNKKRKGDMLKSELNSLAVVEINLISWILSTSS